MNQAEPSQLDVTDPFAKNDGGHTDPLKSKLQSADSTGKEKTGAGKNGPPENVGANKQHGGDVDSEKPGGPNGGDGGINPGSAQKAKDANAAQQADAPVRKEK